jgi:hypothetical protein
MVELTIVFAVATLLGALLVKIFEWRQDVLYGPYIIGNHDAGHTRRPRKKTPDIARLFYASIQVARELLRS